MAENTMVLEAGSHLLQEPLRLSALTIREGASVQAPEGKYAIMTVNGVNVPMEPGTYSGDIQIMLPDQFIRTSVRFGMETVSNFRAGAVINDGRLVSGSSVSAMVQGGSVTDTEAKDFTMESNEWDVNGFYITGDTEYSISGGRIRFTGDGTDDFVGLGAGIAATGNAKVTVSNTSIRTEGIGRGTLFVGGSAEVTLNDCELSTESYVPTAEQMAEGMKMERMMEPPWSIGLRGNGRTLNIGQDGRLNLNRCHVTSNSWGVLSVDGASVNRMNVKDCLIELLGRNGYGCFSIADNLDFDYSSLGDYGCWDTIDHSIFNVPYTGILMSLGSAGGEFKNGSVVNSGRFGAFVHRNNGGKLKINSGSAFRTDSSCIVVKGANTYFELDNAIMEPKNGTILQLMDNDDVGMCNDPFLIPVGETDVRDDRDLTAAVPTEDIFVSISNMTANGNFLNSTTNFIACNRRKPKAPSMPPAGMMPPPGMEPPAGMAPPAGMMPPPGMEPPAGMAPPAGMMPPPGMEPPAGMAPPADDRPEFAPPAGKYPLRGFLGDDLMGAKNLDVRISNAVVNGIISAAAAAYKEGLTEITKENCEELSNITQTPAPPVNNGVIVTLDGKSVWNVTGTSYITKLEIAEGGRVNAASMTVDGVETPIAPGVYTGMIVLNA